jgi:hypothetical protein
MFQISNMNDKRNVIFLHSVCMDPVNVCCSVSKSLCHRVELYVS